MNGISALIRRLARMTHLLSLILPEGDAMRMGQSTAWKRALTRARLC